MIVMAEGTRDDPWNAQRINAQALLPVAIPGKQTMAT
jgi:hypothetical protein